jgi:hypothetical protein
MLGLAVAGAGAVAIALIWRKMVVPFDRMRELSEELNDPGYKITVALDRALEQPQEDCPVACSNDLQNLYAALLNSQPFPSSPRTAAALPSRQSALLALERGTHRPGR